MTMQRRSAHRGAADALDGTSVCEALACVSGGNRPRTRRRRHRWLWRHLLLWWWWWLCRDRGGNASRGHGSKLVGRVERSWDCRQGQGANVLLISGKSRM